MALIAAITTQYLLMGILLLLFMFVILTGSKNLIKYVFLLALLTLVSDLGQTLRNIVQFSAITLFLILFFADYGLNFSSYKKVPGILLPYLFFLFLVMTISSVLSYYPSAGFLLIGRTAVFFILTYTIYSQIYSDQDILNLFKVLLVSAIILSLSTIVEFIQSGVELFNLQAHLFTRSSGILSNVNTVGGLIGNLIPFLLAFLFYSKLSRRKKYYLGALLIILLTGSLLSASRSAYIGIFISVIIILFFLKRAYLKWLLIPIILIIALIYFYEPLNNLFELLIRIDQGLAGREVFWNLSINIINENPWFGIGPGAYQYEAYNYFPVLLDSWRGQTISRVLSLTGGSNASHSIFLLYFSDMGIFGFIAAILLPTVFYSISIPVLKFFKGANEFIYIFTLSVTALGSGLIIRSVFEPGMLNYGYITADLPFWILFAIVCHYYQLTRIR